MKVTPRLPEVLSPAGDILCLRAAIAAGADAVYFGLGGTFNARARAAGFSAEGLEEAMKELHAHGVSGYVTLNTLVFDAEVDAMRRAIETIARAGADAVIVQDLGVISLVREIAPSLRVHASTQTTCTDPGSVAFVHSLGAKRVVLARELTQEDIRAIAESTECELEVFVHGALCIAYSGQCLTSEAFGNRSANRGACAQACRLPYELYVDGVKRDLGERAYLLSPEDLEASAQVPALAELGVCSLKIEGRLKTPEYVAAATALYRRAVDALSGQAAPPGTSERERALQTYSRGSGPGFLAGVDHQRLVEGRGCDHHGLAIGELVGVRGDGTRAELRIDRPIARGDGILIEGGLEGHGEVGGRIWTIEAHGLDVEATDDGIVSVWLGPDKPIPQDRVGARVFRTNAPGLMSELRGEIERRGRRAKISVRLEAKLDSPARLSAIGPRGMSAETELDAITERARTRPTDPAQIENALRSFGETSFAIDSLELDVPSDAMISLSSLKRARRVLTDRLLASGHRPHALSGSATRAEDPKLSLGGAPVGSVTALAALPKGLFVLARNEAQANAALDAGADGVYLDFLALTGAGQTLRTLRKRLPNAWIGLAPPRIRKPGEEKIDRYLLDQHPNALLVRSLGALGEAHLGEVARIGDFSLNVTNARSATEVLSRVASFTPSFDLDSEQLALLMRSRPDIAARAEIVVHHPMPLFHMEHCVFAALMSDGRDHRTCGRPCEKHSITLRDREGMQHPVEADVGCRNTVFHEKAQSAALLVPELSSLGVSRFRIELVREEPSEVASLVSNYQAILSGRRKPRDVWNDLRTKDGYGVVRGSLRVVP